MPLGLADPLGQTGASENHQFCDGDVFALGLECVFAQADSWFDRSGPGLITWLWPIDIVQLSSLQLPARRSDNHPKTIHRVQWRP